MSMHTKDFAAAVKAAGDGDGLGDGVVRMLVSVFNNVDSYGDVVVPGAFADTLSEWKSSGDPIPFIWAHQWSDPFSHIGFVTDAQETAEGLEVTAQLDLDHPKAKQVFGLLKGRRVKQASFGYTVDESGWVEREAPDGAKYEVYELRKLGLIECGPCLVGANQETELLEAKAREFAAGVKAGRVLSQTNFDSLTTAHKTIGEVLASAETSGKTPAAPDTGGKTTSTSQLPDRAADESEDSSAQSPSEKSAQARARLTVIGLA